MARTKESRETPELSATTVDGLLTILTTLTSGRMEICILPREYGDVMQITDPNLDGQEVVLIYIGKILSK